MSTNVNDSQMSEGSLDQVASPSGTVDGVASKGTARPRRKRIPMSVPHARLEITEIPGYYLYWAREDRVPQMEAAYYEKVHKDEVHVSRTEIGGHSSGSGNTDLGSEVSIISGTDGRSNPQRLVLMKLAIEYFKEDQMRLAEEHARRISAIFDNERILSPEGQISDLGQYQYVPEEGRSQRISQFVPVMNRPKRVATIGRPR